MADPTMTASGLVEWAMQRGLIISTGEKAAVFSKELELLIARRQADTIRDLTAALRDLLPSVVWSCGLEIPDPMPTIASTRNAINRARDLLAHAASEGGENG